VARRTDDPARPLKLRAHDAEDLQAIATCLQDALVPVADMAFLKAEKRFVLVANRFRWEASPDTEAAADADRVAARAEAGQGGDARFEDDEIGGPEGLYERVNCGVCFDRVKAVGVRGLNPRETDQILSLLTIATGPRQVTLVFSGGAEIRLEVSQIRCHLEDLGQPWPTHWRPSHALDSEETPDGH
jgi:Protein of unknown function (DUF2948)